jgi:hypothetical protein
MTRCVDMHAFDLYASLTRAQQLALPQFYHNVRGTELRCGGASSSFVKDDLCEAEYRATRRRNLSRTSTRPCCSGFCRKFKLSANAGVWPKVCVHAQVPANKHDNDDTPLVQYAATRRTMMSQVRTFLSHFGL